MKIEFVQNPAYEFVRVENAEEFLKEHPDYIGNIITIEWLEKGGVIYDIHFEQVFGDSLRDLMNLASNADSVYRVYGETLEGIECAIDRAYGKALT